MPTTRFAITKLLAAIEKQLIDAERRLLTTTIDDERTALIDQIADLNIRKNEMGALLCGDDPQENNSASVH